MRAFALLLTILGLVPVVIYTAMTAALRADLIPFTTLFSQLGWLVPALGIGGVAALIAFALMLAKRAVFPALVSLLVAAFAVGMAAGPFLLKQKAGTVPPIHDITTDTQTPPAFVAVLPLREGATNPPAYDPEQTARQLEAYPDLATLVLDRSYAEVFPMAVEALGEEGITVVAAVPAEGRIEGVARTRWFGFADDVVLRLQDAHGRATVVDMRSKSRVGVSDVGANAARIERVLAEIEENAAERS